MLSKATKVPIMKFLKFLSPWTTATTTTTIKSELTKLFTQLKGFKFVTKLFLVF